MFAHTLGLLCRLHGVTTTESIKMAFNDRPSSPLTMRTVTI
jgi:hypothetical protein